MLGDHDPNVYIREKSKDVDGEKELYGKFLMCSTYHVSRQAESKEVVACRICSLHGFQKRGGALLLAQHNSGGQIGST